jgi:hypothetical protein
MVGHHWWLSGDLIRNQNPPDRLESIEAAVSNTLTQSVLETQSKLWNIKPDAATHTGRSPAKSGHSIRPPDWVPWDLRGSNGSHGTCMCPTVHVSAATLVGGRIELAASE